MEIGNLVAESRKRHLLGWTDLQVVEVRRSSTDRNLEYTKGDFPEHAEVLGWAKDGELERRMEQAKDLSGIAIIGREL